MDKKAALKARVAAAIDTSKSKGGLNVGLHPALEDLGSWKPQVKLGDNSNTQSHSQKRPASSRGVHNAIFMGSSRLDDHRGFSNPYYDETVDAQSTGHRRRESKRLVFNHKGKYIQQASAARRQADLDAMKKRIAEQTRKAGIEDDLDVEKNYVPESPPDVEWWDEGLLDTRSYAEIGHPVKVMLGTPDSIVTEYIQHPVALEPPQDRHRTPAKPMFLTPKEQAKLRRQRRKAELKELQAKIRLGLIPAPPPKVKKGNLMRVLGDGENYMRKLVDPRDRDMREADRSAVAVKDPTAVEARVNREIEERHQKHIQSNEERRLTREQKQEKLAKNQENDANRGIHILVFGITTLVNGQHRYKIGVNAEQLDLTGICIMHPKYNLVIVEGGAWSTSRYKKLMLQRMKWTENSSSRRPETRQNSGRYWLQAESDGGSLKDTSSNECRLIFEGELKERAFRKWGSKICETDAQARESLARVGMENFWTLAKSMY
ncbi:hypothetical protein CP532_2930 [Ophiocordyceps camponoti-leonardi (nom. inval.)]|nr:hypothetical protein CP532_2930 [Ophiocordyceps camponoti-leonardi (nom. inval.)]